jgi:hypothetical protein
VKPDPTHQKSLNQIVLVADSELRRRLAVKGYKAPDFVAAEVLASLVKLRHGKSSGLMDVIAAALNERIVMLVERFFRKNPGVLRESSETLVDATVAVWAGLLKDKEALSCGYAEVRFLMFVEARLVDFVRKESSDDGDNISLADIGPEMHDGEAVSFENALPADEDDQPENEAERNKLKAKLEAAYLRLPKPERSAVYFRLECEFDWKKTADLMECSKPTARKYYAQGVARLKGELDDGHEDE